MRRATGKLNVMSSASPCPNQDELRLFLMGQLADPDVESVETHVSECEDCVAVLSNLHAGDPFESAIREAAHRAKPADPDADRLVARIVGSMDSHSQSLATTASAAASSPTDLDLSWLSPPEAGDELGRVGAFRVLRVIGRGGMGVVFEAEDLKLQRRLALKVMLPKAAADPAGAARFLREARASAKVRHSNVVTVYQADSFGTVPFIAMELLRGESLHERLRRVGQLPLKDVFNLGRQIALGLAAAHAQGLLHRDIKPANIWLEQCEDGDVIAKVLDFGLARSVEGDGSLTQSGMIVGTPQYMAPEQARGATPNIRSDLFSLGCVLYQMTTGRQPFVGRNVLDQLRALAVDVPPQVSELRDNAPSELSRLIHQLLEKVPSSRPASATDVAERLREIATPQVQSPQVNPWPWRRSSLITVSVMVGIVVIVCVVFRDDRSTNDGTPLASATSPNSQPAIANTQSSDLKPRRITSDDSGDLSPTELKTGALLNDRMRDAPTDGVTSKASATAQKVAADSAPPVSGNSIPTTIIHINKKLTGLHEYPAVACGQQSTLVVWQGKESQQSGWDIYGTVVSPDHSVGSLFVINEFRPEDQTKPSVVAADDGSFVVVWESMKQDGSDSGIFARRIGPDGLPLGDEFQVNSFTLNSQTTARVAIHQSGRFMIVWGSLYQVQGWDVFGQYFAEDGTKEGAEFRVNEDAKFNQSYPSVALMADGSAVVAFQRSKGDQALYDIGLQRFSADHSKSGSEVFANTHTHRSPPWGKALPDIATDGVSRFVVVWHDYHGHSPQDGSESGVFGQNFDLSGNKIGPEFQVNETSQGIQADPSVAMFENGNFMVVWQGNGIGDSNGVFGRIFNADSEPLVGEFRLNEFTEGEQSQPKITTTWNGQFAVAVWRGAGPSEKKGVFAKWISASSGLRTPSQSK